MRTGEGERQKTEYRCYEMPPGGRALLLTREQIYKEEPDVLHFHNVLEIGYCYQGEGVMLLKDESVPFGEGTFTMIPRGFPHMTTSDDNALSYWKYLFVDSDGLLKELYGAESAAAQQFIGRINGHPWIFQDTDEKENAELVLQLLRIMKEQKVFYREEFKGLMLTLLVRMAGCSGEENKEAYDRETAQPSRNSMIISRAVDYISKVPERPVKVEELAKMCHISETHFRRVFGECMQMSPVEYINRVRVKRACDALEKTNYSIGDIAAGAGFGTTSTFNRNFRQIMGVSPQQWRKNVREPL